MIAVPCNLCGQDDWRIRFPATTLNTNNPEVNAFCCTSTSYGSHPQIVECNNCGFVYANPRLTAQELLALYAAVRDDTYVVERAGRVRTFGSHLEALERFTGPGGNRPLLDVGAYIGVFVEVALARGWRAMGVEPSHWATAEARKKGLPVIQGTLGVDELEGRRFDVITMWDVIEHLDDPAAEVARSFAYLKPGGILVVHTMDVDSFFARIMGRRWPWLMDMHLHYFNRETLGRLMTDNGLEILWIGAEGRYLSLRYLVSRLGGISRPLGRLFGGLVRAFRLEDRTAPVNFGDLITIYARRPDSAS